MTTRDTRSHIIACKCLLDMGIEKASPVIACKCLLDMGIGKVSGDGGTTTYIYICILKTGVK